MSGSRQLLFGMYLDAMRMDEVIDKCRAALNTRSRLMLGVVNAAKIVNLRKDTQLRDSLIECDLLLADGQSVVWASKLFRRPLPERVAGIDIFQRLLRLANDEERSIALLGARPEVLSKLEKVIAERFPEARIVFSRNGYFGAGESAEIAAGIRDSAADILFIGMTSPLKEIFLATHAASLGVPILHGVGGSFDVMAGLTRRAPLGWQKVGMEWAYRVLLEPRRLWWRYLSTNTRFIQLTAVEAIRPARAFRHS
ncbi:MULTISPECIES: WecB/TagA/CpsF family glycosyltransferase [unclassified Rhizobium]|uniref:WecB/TagA/CpsF family glycosyltransferase n=2 Tax=Rhizobium TaxID=379 RepID=UPI0017DDF2BA|nr:MULTISPECIES: WecB/TagA/CpsF family glycosyltransferase [unclassified Rhizobium]MBB3318083.1 N-acetylglucosaminyldiphosphoundecaprenol N-acetyl-beta-D-mannosaminyltransferase [Rhizobium sp. BK181]MBB3544963.1 N-acetylglucosaminyldiphosphoundecaprenol N-acetyl-beta-D-mannosaminyltransferase [Rhizobium sp. BK399]